tara:strand:+ start:45 stop:488 length:444 start_codon:yes stop_codon:yes gene_type:complete
MSKVYQIGISDSYNKNIEQKEIIDLIAGKGIVGDRYFRDFNGENEQITLIESENIDYYNNKFKKNFKYLDFRRNIVTKSILLNDLIGRILIIGEIKIRVNNLCRPCKDLQNKLGESNIIKEFLRRGGVRCEILTSGKIKVGDEILIN